MRNSEIDYEYGVRIRDERDGTVRVDTRPSLVMAQDCRDMFREAYADGGTYLADAVVVMREEGTTGWTVLTDEDIARIIAEAWASFDRAMVPVLASGLAQLADQQRRARRPHPSSGEPA